MRWLWVLIIQLLFVQAQAAQAAALPAAIDARFDRLSIIAPAAAREWRQLRREWQGAAENLLMTADLERDRMPQAVATLRQIRRDHGKRAERMEDLAIATALVHDVTLRRTVNGKVTQGESGLTIFASLVAAYESGAGHLADLPPELLVFVVDSTISADEAAWARAKFAGTRPASWYSSVRYVNERLHGHTQDHAAPYTLQHILANGGVCADRAFFATHVAKSLAVPAAIMRAEGSGETHAWVAHLVNGHWIHSGRGKAFAQLGGTIRSPQTTLVLSEHELAARTSAADIGRERRLEALALVEMSRGSRSPDLLLERALFLDPGCIPAWREAKRRAPLSPTFWLERAELMKHASEALAVDLVLELIEALPVEQRQRVQAGLRTGTHRLDHDMGMDLAMSEALALEELGDVEAALAHCAWGMHQHGLAGRGVMRMARTWQDLLERHGRGGEVATVYEAALAVMPDFSERSIAFRIHTARYALEQAYERWKQSVGQAG